MKITLTKFTQAFPIPESKPNDFQSLHDKAHTAGMKAGENAIPAPMTVYQADFAGNPIGKSWFVSEGACGFASVKFKGNTAWGKWAKAQGIASPAYPKGLHIWVGQFNQSIARKEAYAHAYVEVLREAGIEAYAESRLD